MTMQADKIKWLLALLVIAGLLSGIAYFLTNRKKWEFEVKGDICGSPVVAPDGTVYASSTSGYLYAINPAGELRWKSFTGPVWSSPLLSGNTIYVRNSEGWVYAINSDGSQRWAVSLFASKTKDYVTGLATDGRALYVDGYRDFHALSLGTGETLWVFPNAFVDNYGTPTVARDGSVAFLSFGVLTVLDARGSVRWRYPGPVQINVPGDPEELREIETAARDLRGGRIPLPLPLISPLALATDGTYYFAIEGKPPDSVSLTARGRLRAVLDLEAANSGPRLVAVTAQGNYKWGFPLGRFARGSPVVGLDGTVYVASEDFHLYALRPEASSTRTWLGDVKWSFKASGPIETSPVLAADGTIYFVAGARLFAVTSEGRFKWDFSVGSSVVASPALARDGTIYVATKAGRIYAIKGDGGGGMSGTWSKYQHDAENSGNAAHP